MNANYKLTYFNYRGLGEPVRYIFKLAAVEFEDNRIEWDEKWEKELKNLYPWGKLPVLEFGDEKLAESVAICRYLAKKFDMDGENDFESAKCDEVVDALVELKNKCLPVIFESDPVKQLETREKFFNETLKFYFGKLVDKIEGNQSGWIIGSKITWADVYTFHTIEYLESSLGENNITETYPTLKSYKEKIAKIPQIAAWIEARPETLF